MGPFKADVVVAKNYLSETELRTFTPVEQAYIAQLEQEAKKAKGRS